MCMCVCVSLSLPLFFFLFFFSPLIFYTLYLFSIFFLHTHFRDSLLRESRFCLCIFFQTFFSGLFFSVVLT